jgi:hypothetical protein
VDVTSLVGRSIRNLWAFRLNGVHPAWIDANTFPIAAGDAVIELSDGNFVKISPCEVSLGPDRYPALGLEAQPCSERELRFRSANGEIVEAEQLVESASLVQFHISRVDALDPLGEGQATQYSFHADDGDLIEIRHMMPPMTLGIRLSPAAGTPNQSWAYGSKHR